MFRVGNLLFLVAVLLLGSQLSCGTAINQTNKSTYSNLGADKAENIATNSNPASSPPKPNAVIDPDLEKNRRLWQEKGITNYNFVNYKMAGAMSVWARVLIKVRNSQFVSMEPPPDRRELERIDGYEDFNTIEKLFDKLQEAYDKGYLVRVKYNKEFGYPEFLNINSLSDSDSGFAFEISLFQIVPD